MAKRTLHITNGYSLTNYLKELDYTGDMLTWQEMLCEGPTAERIDSDEFFDKRKRFFLDFYDIEINEREFREEIAILNDSGQHSEIILWFEYDLFCHINLIAVISLIRQKNNKLPLYLVCSGRIKGEKELKGLAELTPRQLQRHYDNRIPLSEDDIELMASLWKTYCGKDHNLFRQSIVQKSSFPYLSNCLKAHLRRFPEAKTGLTILENNILNIIKKYPIKSRKHLLGYALNYQGYYGYTDLQFIRIIDKLSIFFDESGSTLTLSRKGHEALLGHHNFANEFDSKMAYGGVRKNEYHYSTSNNRLIQTVQCL